MGDEATAADYMAMYSIDLAAAVAKKVYDWDILADMPGAADLLETLNSTPDAQSIAKEKAEQMAAFVAKVSGR